MMMTFCKYDLRTTDVDGARVFYEAALGFKLGTDSRMAVWPLHEQARARGAPAHWLGMIGVTNLSATAEKLLSLGGQLLGPPLIRGEDGVAFAILRDPCEAVVAVREDHPSAMNKQPIVAWHQLHTRDRDRSWSIYSDLFGWKNPTGDITIDYASAPSPEGGYRMFRWANSDKDVGAIANTARLPGVHPHWLYYFPTRDLESALASVVNHGGLALPIVTLPNGDRLAACEDPQKAAFGLVQIARSDTEK